MARHMSSMNLILRIALDTPLRRLFDYLPPLHINAAQLHPGVRVRVPFGRRQMVGILVSTGRETGVPVAKLRRAQMLLDTSPVFDATLFALLQWSAEYYRHPLGEVLATALPAPLRAGAALTAEKECWQLTDLGKSEARDQTPKRATRLHALLDVLADGQLYDTESLAAAHDDWRGGLRTLQQRGYVQSVMVERGALPPGSPEPLMPVPVLGSAQQAALAKIVGSLGSFTTLLLYGVTGSGKTEVYLQVIRAVLQRGEQALVLAPEIALTPQLLDRFRARFAVPIAVLHSGLNDSERLAAWRAARSGEAGIVIGTRSAIFTAMDRPGLIIVDEEHDASYKQQEGFRYSARDLAIARAQRHGIPVVLGSATPSLESLLRTQRKPGDLLRLPDRAGGAQAPRLRLVDLRQHAANQGLSTPVMLSIRKHLDTQGQVLVYLNRRGFAPVLFCPSCGWSAPCPRCDARLTVHKRQHKLVCHHCAHEQALSSTCPSCQAEVKPVGQGTERIEDTLQQIYPDAPLARLDRDSTSRKGELDATLTRVQSGEVKILVGTQMLSKGHHFPNVTLVVILDADQGLFSTDFRASEKLAQSIVQVSGRAGRGDRPGEVLIQTEYPDHPLLQRLLREGYEGFAAAALQEREQAHWPPFTRIALLRAEASDLAAAMRFLQTTLKLAHVQLGKPHSKSRAPVRILGPAPAPMTRRAGLHRAQLLFHAATPGPLQTLLAGLLPKLEDLPEAKRVRWSVDVDPIELF
jgi:primosomal protein N' (replication factor Y) (superfamily II helicase)